MGITLRCAPLALLLSFAASAASPTPPVAPARPATPAGAAPAEPSPAAVAQSAAASSALQATQAIADPIPLVGNSPELIRVPSATEAWGGERDPSNPVLSQRVADYDLEAKIDPVAHTVEGSEVLRWKNRSAVPIRTVYFHLYLNAFEGPHTTWMIEKGKAPFRSGVDTKKGQWGYIDVLEMTVGGKPVAQSFAHPDGGPETDHSVLRAELPEPVAPGATVEIKIKFHDQLPRVIARTGWFDSFHLVAQWFPKIGVLELPGERGATVPRWNVHEFHLYTEFYADFGSYNLQVTAPKGVTVAAFGQRVGEPRETADGVVHRFHQDDIHDAVFTAWDKYAPPISGTYEGKGSPRVTVEVYFPSEMAASGAVTLQTTLDSLKYFSDTLGPYPYPHLTAIIPPVNAGEAGGMEYETFFTSEGGNGLIGAATRFTAVHEFGHGYFMGLLASNEFEEPFLDEGMNELWDTRMLGDETFPFESFPPLSTLAKLGLHLPGINYRDVEQLAASSSRFEPDPLAQTSWGRYSEGSFVGVYSRTTMVMHDLEEQLGEAFARGMKLYYKRWHHRHPSAADLRAALVDGCDLPEQKALVMSWFEQQIYATTAVDDEVTLVESEEMHPEAGTEIKDGKRVEIDRETLEKNIAELRENFHKQHGGEKGHGGDPVKADGSKDAPVKDAAAKDAAAKDGESDFKPGPFPFRSVVKAQRRRMQIAQTLRVKFEDGTTQTILWPVGETWHKWVFDGPARIQWAQLDPDRKILLDINKLDDGRMREGESGPGRRWTLEVGHWTELFFAMVGGL